MNLDELSDDDDDEISLSSNLSAEAAENVKAISVENAFMEVTIVLADVARFKPETRLVKQRFQCLGFSLPRI